MHASELLRLQGVDSKIDARPWAISIIYNPAGCDREKVFLDFLDLARAQRGLFRLFSQQGAQNGPRSPCYAYCRSRAWWMSAVGYRGGVAPPCLRPPA